MKLIALDVGERRIGVAFGDSSMRLATPMDVIVRSSPADDARAIAALLREYDAEAIVVGLPRNSDGTVGPQAQASLAFAKEIGPVVSVPIEFWDEHLTTIEAHRRSQERQGRAPSANIARRRRARAALDAMAAAVILQDYLDDRASKINEDIT